MTNEKKYKGDKMKTYKGFNKDMTCRDFQYEEGKEYEATGEIKCCNNGFHACEDPLDCFNYYAPGKSVYHEVEQSGEISRNNDGESKVASSKIKIGARLDIAKIVRLHFDFIKSRTTFENTDPEQASAGEQGAASAGERGAASAGERGAASAGWQGAASAGWRGAASAGAYGAAVSKGSADVGENGIACVRGNGCKVKGGIGAILVIAEENEYDSDIKEWKAFVVDGEKIKADTYYTLKHGEIVEADND